MKGESIVLEEDFKTKALEILNLAKRQQQEKILKIKEKIVIEKELLVEERYKRKSSFEMESRKPEQPIPQNLNQNYVEVQNYQNAPQQNQEQFHKPQQPLQLQQPQYGIQYIQGNIQQQQYEPQFYQQQQQPLQQIPTKNQQGYPQNLPGNYQYGYNNQMQHQY